MYFCFSESRNKNVFVKITADDITCVDLIKYNRPQLDSHSLFCSKQNTQYTHDNSMDAGNKPQIRHIKPTGSPTLCKLLCYYRRVPCLELTVHGDVSASK